MNEVQLVRKDIAELVRQMNWLLQNPQVKLPQLHEVKLALDPVVTKLKAL